MTASEGGGPLDRLLDLVFYAPLGLLLRARDEVPRLAEQGRNRVSSQAPLAKMVGQMAVAQGRRQVEGLIDRLSPPAAGSGAPGSPGGAKPAASGEDVHPVPAPKTVPDALAATDVVPAPDAADLPIPGYDTLSASQVVQRLPGLSPDELEAVRAYEQARRARKTVLLRVAQLRAGA